MKTLKGFLLSAKTAVGLMAGIAAFCLAGSAAAPGKVFVSPWFLATAAVLCLALAYAVFILSRRNLRLKAPAGKWGGPVLHLGMLLVILSGFLTLSFHKRGFIQMMVGETFDGEESGFLEKKLGAFAGPFSVRFKTHLLDFEHSHWENRQVRSLESSLILSNRGKIAHRKISVNAPVVIDGVAIYQSFHYGYSLSLAIEKPGASPVITHFLLDQPKRPGMPAIGLSDFPTTNYIFKLQYYPETSRLYLNVLEGGKAIFQGSLKPGISVRLPEGILSMADVRPWSGLIYVQNRWALLAYIGFALGVLGAGMIFLLPRRAVEVESHA